MLSHHFGSKDGLWVAIVEEVERRQVVALPELVADASVPFEQAMRSWWKQISDPTMWPVERLFFEVYVQGLHGKPPARDLLDGIVESWLGPATEQLMSTGVPEAEARSLARLGLAVVRGLLLDLLATEDRAGVDAAMQRWIDVVDPVLKHAAAPIESDPR